jgi:PAS domain S-box-containing protein
MKQSSAEDFIRLLGDSKAAAAIARHDWSATALGPLAQWQRPLKSAVAMIARSPMPMALLCGERGILLYNEGYRCLVSEVPAAALGICALDEWPQARACHREIIERVGEGASLTLRDVMHFPPRGSSEPVRHSIDCSPLFDDDGAVFAALLLVTAHSGAWRAGVGAAVGVALQHGHAPFRTLAQALPSQVWTAGPDGCLDWVNRCVLDYIGAARLAARGPGNRAGWTDFIHADDLAFTSALWQESLASGAAFETEFRLRRDDGEFRWHLSRALPLHGADGGISGWIGTSTDIHANKLLEARSKRDHNRIWTLSQELMLICGFDGVIAAVNPSAARLLGWSEGEMAGRTLSDFIHPDDLAATAAEVMKLGHGIPTLSFENRYRAKDGAYHLVNWTAVPDGGMIHAVGRDISRERATEEALHQSQKLEAIGQLTGGVAHDFNNVLAVIRTAVDMMRLVQLTDERRTRYVNAISDAVTRATTLTAQLLAFARRQALRPVLFDVNDNIRMVSAMIGSLTGARVELLVSPSLTPCFVDADPSQFDTAIINLAVNARDAMDGKGRLEIAVRPAPEIPAVRGHAAIPGQFVAVSVVDTGVGMSDELILKIFEPFFTTKGVGHGTGLGLSQVFGFAKQSGGDVAVSSAPGEGAAFTLYLPRSPAGAGAVPLPASPLLESGRGACVLVVEDNPDLAKSVEMTLEEIGYRTVCVFSGEQALHILAEDSSRFAVVFSDVVMGGMNGIELATQIGQHYPALPVVLSSGYSYILATNPDHGFTLLPKPYALEELARTLQGAISGDLLKGPVGSAVAPTATAAMQAHHDAAAFDDELFRQAELDGLGILDTASEAAFDDIVRVAAEYCGVPIALVSLIDADRQWFKSRFGLDAQETPRAYAFCDHAIRVPEQTMVVRDASLDTRFASNPLVTGDPGIRFYAGAPLLTSNGQAIGTLCVIDRVARTLDASQMAMLELLARRVVQMIEERHAATLRDWPSGKKLSKD